jgi:acyl-CoA reductase-like NAD-dependent aldehyde dehydrogenase
MSTAMSAVVVEHRPLSAPTAAFLSAGAKQLLIGGDWVDARGGETIPSLDPATGAQIAAIARASAADVDAAARSARDAFVAPSWAAMAPAERSALLWRIADAVERHADELAELECLDQGKNWRTARFGEVPAAIAQFRYYAGWPTKILGDTIPTSLGLTPPGKQILAYTRREPVGVVAAIVPWNSPLLMACMKLAPALAAGCTVILKPAENTSLSAIRLGELLLDCGLPPGVVNVVTGLGTEAGQALVEHPLVAKVAFTGSTATGKRLIEAAAGDITRLTLELGGKSPSLVLADADVAGAAKGIGYGIFNNCGQVCVASSRVYAHASVYDELVAGLAEQGAALRLGHGLADGADIGPLASEPHARKVDAMVRDGVSQGAQLISGGERLGPAGTFYRPTVVANVSPAMDLVRDEVFGPVVVVTPFDDLDEVTEQANDSRYGLAASIWTESLSSAHRLAARLQAGTVWINCHSFLGPELPKGGHKQSGWGYENGPQGLENYLETKTVVAVI